MITQGPFNLTIGTTLPLSDPGANSNHPATAVQLQNSSPFIIEVNAGGTVLTIQSFTAQTVPTSGGGQQMSVLPIQTNQAGTTTATKALTVVWLLAGESSPMVDGSLTAAAIASAITGALTNYNVGGGSMTGNVNIGAGATVTVAPAPPAGKCYRIQLFFADVAPTGDQVMVLSDASIPAVLAFLLPGKGSFYLGGQLCFGAIEITNQGTSGAEAGVTYDTIAIPVSP